ncbi:MAG TPA: hypothetical protein VLT47_15995 [Anaeromyxobacteraceae bacterium]|nr:hypothetical protein [Anaeromyxobacteraceae bacterium]
MTPEEEERGWETLRQRWDDDGAHRAWLAGFTDLEGLARAGQRYRAALEADPADRIAARWRDEVVKRATVAGLASLPRTAPAPPIPRWVRRTGAAILGALLAALLGWAAAQLLGLARR